MILRKLLIASSLFLASACGGPAELDEQEPSATPGTAEVSEERSALWLYCGAYDGQACTTPGNRFKCYNQYPYEPGICSCGSDYTYSCG